MGVKAARRGIGVGIVTGNREAALTFYESTLGFARIGERQLPAGGMMYRLSCEDSLIGIIAPDPPPGFSAPAGGFAAATGFRVLSVAVGNLDEMVALCRSRGYKVAVEPREALPGITTAIVEDPDGNWVEFIQGS